MFRIVSLLHNDDVRKAYDKNSVIQRLSGGHCTVVYTTTAQEEENYFYTRYVSSSTCTFGSTFDPYI